MRRIFAVLICCAFALPAYAQPVEEVIPSFDARITVRSDAVIEVAEQIVYDFGTDERHGIFRTIPYTYEAGDTLYEADVRSVFVYNENNEPIPFSEHRENGELTIRIGDADRYVTGEQTYVISYQVRGPFLYFDEQDELYWNVTGAWKNGIASSTVLVDLPEGAQVLSAACYKGGEGTDGECEESERLVRSDRAGFYAVARDLGPYEGMSVAVAFPKGVIDVVERAAQPRGQGMYAYEYAPLALPAIVLFGLAYLWYTRGRDPKGRSTIVTQFVPPDGVSPALAGIVYNERIEPREISAEIVALAVGGYLTIHRIERSKLIFTETDYLLERRGEELPEDPAAALLLERLFSAAYEGTEDVDGKEVQGTLISKMREKFNEDRDDVVAVLYDEVLRRGYFLERPDLVRKWYAGVGLAIAGLSAAGFIFEPRDGWLMLVIAGIASGVLVALWGLLMPAKTRAGVLLKEHLEGFKRYLSVAEADRLAFHNAPDRTPEEFDKHLPYAISFGVEKAWAQQFEGIYDAEPSWYHGTAGSFNASTFAQEVSAFTTDVAAASAPKSSGASGGGSVGGGFGGGGGGSW